MQTFVEIRPSCSTVPLGFESNKFSSAAATYHVTIACMRDDERVSLRVKLQRRVLDSCKLL